MCFTRPYIRTFILLIYRNDLPQGLKSDAKLLADNTSLFLIGYCAKAPASAVNGDFLKTHDWS